MPDASASDLERHPDGVSLRLGAIRLRIHALRPDLLRVRIGRDGALPEDASWAATPAARAAQAGVAHHQHGFDTEALQVRIDPVTGSTEITDRDGRPILADATDAPFKPQGPGFRLAKQLRPRTHLYGLGEKAGPLDRRGRVVSMWNTDAYRYQESTDPLYKSIPFMLGFEAGAAWGLLLDNSFRSVFDLGVQQPDRMVFGADGGEIDYYVLAGPSPKDVLSAYGWLTGLPPLPPLWSFGFQQSRYSYHSAAEVRALAAELRARRIPCDVIWFDIHLLDRFRPFTTDPEAFPDFPALVRELRAQGFRAVVIADLHIPLLPGENYAPYETGAAGGHFIRDASGETFVGKVWPGDCAFPDFTRKATRDWWAGLLATPDLRDVAGIWCDMNEPSVFATPSRTMPLDALHRIEEPGFESRDATHAEIHNVLGQQNARATYDGLLALRPDRRPYVMSRAAYAGSQRYGVVWTGDNSSTWNQLRLSTPMLLGLGLSGLPFCGCDLGGFTGSPTPDLLTRWLQLGMFNPVARNHSDFGSKPQEAWVHGPDHEALRRRAIEERYRLLPYIYTLAEEAARTGIPMMRPLFMEFPDAAGGYPLDGESGNQFMFGDALMVAPAPYPDATDDYQVILPAGDWYDYWTGEAVIPEGPAKLTGGSGNTLATTVPPGSMPQHVTRTPRLDELPVFARAGSIIPRQAVVQHTGEQAGAALELLVLPAGTCSGAIYADAGDGTAHQSGAWARQAFSAQFAADGSASVTLHPVVNGQGSTSAGGYTPWWREVLVRVAGRPGPGLRLPLPGTSPVTSPLPA